MKKIYSIFIILLLIFYCGISAYAHPGSLDENGGHYNTDTGEYHYHDGDHTINPTPTPTKTPDPTIPKTDERSDFSYFLESLIDFLCIPVYIIGWILFSAFLNIIIEKLLPKSKSKIIEYASIMLTLGISAIIVGYVGIFLLNFVKKILF